MPNAAADGADGVLNEILNAFAYAPEDIVGSSPPGAGKTTLIEDLTAFAVHRLDKTIMIACPSNDQANDVTARIARSYPGIRIDRFVASGGRARRAWRLQGLANTVAIVDDAKKLTARVTIATVAKYAEVKSLGDTRDFAILDEAYQVRAADYLRIRDLARRTVAIGDPGQIDPIAQSSIRHFANDPCGPHVAAPRMMLAENTARGFKLPLSRRLPQDTVDVVQPSFYPALDFKGVALAGERRLDAAARGATATDRLLDRAIAAGSLAMIALPPETRPRVDHEVIGLAADIVDRVIARRFNVFDGDHSGRAIEPEDIGIVVFHRDQVAAIRAALAPRFWGVHVETANRFQGLERKLILSLHPLSGKMRLDGFSTEAGRMCVAASRHRVNCIIVGRDGVGDVLDRFAPDDGMYLGQVDDPYYDGWRAHRALDAGLEERNRIIRP